MSEQLTKTNDALSLLKGYKQTEVGLIPEDWKLHQVNDLIELLTDYDANGSFSSVAENVKVFDFENFAWYVRSTDLENNTKMSEVRYVDEQSYKFLKKTALFGGELLFLKRGDIGNVYLFEMKTKYATVAPNLYLLKLNETSNSKYLFYYFTSNQGQLQLKKKNASSTLGALYKDDVKSIYVPLPPTLTEQKAIATALSDVDALISSLERLITKKKAIKQGAMQELLTPPQKGGKRLPGFSGEWEEKTIESLCEKNGLIRGPFGGALKKESFVSNGHKVYEQKNAIYKSTEIGSYFIDDNKFKELQRFEVLENDYILSCSGTIGKLYQIPPNSPKGIINQALLIIRIDNSVSDYAYFKHQFTSDVVQQNVIDDTQGGAMKNLVGMADFKKATIPYPPLLEEQKAIAQILSDMDLEIEALEAKKAKYQDIKQGMMQELLTGKTRLV